MELPIIFQDAHYIAINKPAGLLVHRSSMDVTETEFAVQGLREQIGQKVYPVHRLDKPTSGVLLFALDPEGVSRLSEQFTQHSIHKSYLAIVRGYTPDKAHIDHPVKAQQDKFSKHKEHPQGITDLKTLARCELDIPNDKYRKSRYSLVELTPQTGRRHQLRYHMKHLSHPIIGDPKYGKREHNAIFKTHFGSYRLLLASVGLTFEHPFLQKQIHLYSLPSPDFMAVAQRLGWEEVLRLDCQS